MYKLKKMVVLVGLMGAGKSSIGNKLSDFLNVGFIDADNEIEKAAGMTIVEIFEKFGEKSFNQLTIETVKAFLKDSTKSNFKI